ncbi:precorrin-6A/cobalt-precorrin-6A reductase [Pseudooceanicola sp. C21-150M6]|uniref:precorrin-6A/cobalt-precorrin-6A reductase n=1 Tax=Pseudooceanicola sp. C21-150M6 TaxID=3434355 RepID=UPI003D7FBE94
MILLLAGTAEARQLGGLLRSEGIVATASFAGITGRAESGGLPVRIGGFGGADGFLQYVSDGAVTSVIDATHPFAARISDRTAGLCHRMGLPYLRLDRPEWQPEPDDRWADILRPEDLNTVIPPTARVFLAVGQNEIDRYRGLRAAAVTLRSLADATDLSDLPPGWQGIAARPPFAADDEAALFDRLGIDWLVTKNSGGSAAAPKLLAARRLRLRVAMIQRPPAPPDAHVVRDVPSALAWAREIAK